MKTRLTRIIFISLLFSIIVLPRIDAAEEANFTGEKLTCLKILQEFRFAKKNNLKNLAFSKLQDILAFCPTTEVYIVKQQDNATVKKLSPYHTINHPFELEIFQEFTEVLTKVSYLKSVFDCLPPEAFQRLINSANEHERVDGAKLYNYFKGVIDKLSAQDVAGDKKD